MLGLCHDYDSYRRLPLGVLEDARLLLPAIEMRNKVLASDARRRAG